MIDSRRETPNDIVTVVTRKEQGEWTQSDRDRPTVNFRVVRQRGRREAQAARPPTQNTRGAFLKFFL